MPSIAPIGTDITVNTVTTNYQQTPVTAQLANGRFIVVWIGDTLVGPLSNANYQNADIRAQIFNADGTPSGGEFVVNTTTSLAQIAPTVIQLTDGNILIAWQDQIGSLSSPASTPAAAIRAQEFTDTGIAVGSEFQIGAGAEAILPAIAPVAGGGFVAAWQQGRSGNIVAQVYNSANTAVGSQIAIDTTSLAIVTGVRLATLTNGNFVVGWANNPITNSAFSLQVYDTSGTAVSGEIIRYGGNPTGQLGNIVALASGGFAVSSQYNLGTSVTLANVDLFFANGDFGTTTQITQQPINTQTNIRIAPTPNGGLVATWVDQTATGSQPDLRIQLLNPIGDLVGVPATVNTVTSGAQFQPFVSALSTGDLVVAWRDDSGTTGEIRARLIDYNASNAAPVAPVLTTLYVAGPNGENVLRFDPAIVGDLATDPDGDPLRVDSITNVANGTAAIDADNTLVVTYAQPLTGALAFDYTVTDENGGFATGRVRIVNPTDTVTLRGTAAAVVDFTANDFLLARSEGYAFSENSDYTQLATIGGRTQMIVNPFGGTTSYYDQLVGTNVVVTVPYFTSNPQTSAIDYVGNVRITLQGWAQIGGTGTDFLAGTALADSLQGGTGAANELIGGAGDDVYTSRAAGDTIVELAGGGIDLVRTDLAVFVLPANVENLQQIGNPASFVGVGNAENNSITGLSFGNGSVLAGLGGNDTLTLLSFNAAELIGGTGDDTYVFTGANISVVEFSNEGIDTVRTGLSTYSLGANVENLTFTGTGQFQGLGNASDNILTGGTAGSVLVGLDGNDTYVVRNIGDTIVEAAGGGTDTVQTALPVYVLNAANVENLTYTGTGSFTGVGNALNNVITGGAGADYLFAGAGTDTLTGGAGADVFLFDAAVNGIDAVTDFTSGQDRLFFAQTVFTHTPSFALAQGAAPVATSTNSTFLYNSTTGLLSYDADGTGAGAAIAIATLSTGLTLTTADFVFYG